MAWRPPIYLASEYGISNVAVLEKGWIGSGNAGRNTTIIRSNYLLPGNIRLLRAVDEAVGEAWSRTSTTTPWSASAASSTSTIPTPSATPMRGAATPCASTASMPSCSTATAVREDAAVPRTSTMRAFPIQGGLLQRRGGTARHDAVVWGYARARRPRAASTSSRTARSPAFARDERPASPASRPRAASIGAGKVGMAVAGNSSRVAAMAGLRLPIESHVLQAFVSEGDQAADPRRHHLRRRPFLRQPVRQGRAGLRRRHRRLQFLRPARQPAGGGGRLRGRHGADADDRPRARCCASGAASWTCRWTARRSSTGRRSTGSISMPAGATAASRRRRPRAGASRICSRATSRTSEARAFRLDRFRRGHMIDEKGAGAQPNLH